jgi:peptide/nickel transport system substrate-binding protein
VEEREFDRTYTAADSELDPVKRGALFIKMNDLAIRNVVVDSRAVAERRVGLFDESRGMDLTGWDSTFWRLPYWNRQG